MRAEPSWDEDQDKQGMNTCVFGPGVQLEQEETREDTTLDTLLLQVDEMGLGNEAPEETTPHRGFTKIQQPLLPSPTAEQARSVVKRRANAGAGSTNPHSRICTEHRCPIVSPCYSSHVL